MIILRENLWELEEYSFKEWTNTFLRKVDESRLNEKPWLLGYSLGGRLAWHAVLKKPDWWSGYIIVAAHPGYSDQKQQNEQLARDEKWAHRFQTEPWESLINEWDQLPVFGGISSTVHRVQREYPAETLARIFTGFSKGKQANLLPEITRLNTPPMVYISGELDAKYTNIGAELAAKSEAISHITIPNACHRVPWENTADFIKTIQYFIDQ